MPLADAPLAARARSCSRSCSSLVLRRMSTLIARTRDLERYQQAVTGLDERSTAVVGPAGHASWTAARRQAGRPGRAPDAVAAAQGHARRPRARGTCSADAGRRSSPRPCRSRPSSTARPGRPTWPSTGSTPCRRAPAGRDLEAQTSLKRGALNLRHAQEAIAKAGPRGRGAPAGGHRDADRRRGGRRCAGLARLPGARRRRRRRARSNPACSGILASHHKG